MVDARLGDTIALFRPSILNTGLQINTIIIEIIAIMRIKSCFLGYSALVGNLGFNERV